MSAYYWFQGASVEALRDQLAEATEDTRVEVRVAEGGAMTFTVVPDGVTANAPINDSHRCPPSCP